MAPFMLLAVLYLAGLIGGLVLVLRSNARVNAAQINRFPSTVDLYTAVIASAFKPKKAGKPRKVEGLQVRGTEISIIYAINYAIRPRAFVVSCAYIFVP
jgi:hypothetical protein